MKKGTNLIESYEIWMDSNEMNVFLWEIHVDDDDVSLKLQLPEVGNDRHHFPSLY